MDKRLTISVGGREVPCYPTMGAALGFKQQTGRDVEEMKGSADFAVYLYCCAKSACNREKAELGMSLEEFCDGILVEDMAAMNERMAGNGGEKKTP